MNYKKIPNEYFVTIIDRLSRIEPAYIRYNRVFEDIITKFSNGISVKNLEIDEKIRLTEDIIAYTLDSNTVSRDLIDTLYKLEDKYFISNEISYRYLSSRLNYFEIVSRIQKMVNLPKNVVWFKELVLNDDDMTSNRQNKSLLYPIEKIILCEGQTEHVLLETIFNLFDINFDKSGYMVVQAGGKNQVARKYYEMIEYCKLPFFILLDKDAIQIKELIDSKIRTNDILYLIKSGEFEDLIPKKVLKNSINDLYKNDFQCSDDDFEYDSNVKNLENIHKKYGFGEFKKAHYAQNLKAYITNHTSKEDFMNSEITDIINCFID